MATVTESEATGRALRVLRSIDASGNSSWYKLSLWSRASDTFFSDNKTAQAKLGAINGITSDINGTATDIAASINVVNNTKTSLTTSITNVSNEVNNTKTSLTTSITNVSNEVNNTKTSLTTSITNVSNVANAANVRSTNNETYMGGCRFFYENGKYYIQAGADTGTKKPLGSGLEGMKKLVYRMRNDSQSVRWTKTIQKDGDWIIYTEDRKKQYDSSAEYLNVVKITSVSDPFKIGANNGHQTYDHIGLQFHINLLFPNDYRDWTADNFVFEFNGITVNCWHAPSNNVGGATLPRMTKEYNPSTGELNIRGIYGVSNEQWSNQSDPENTNGGRTGIDIDGYTLYIVS